MAAGVTYSGPLLSGPINQVPLEMLCGRLEKLQSALKNNNAGSPEWFLLVSNKAR